MALEPAGVILKAEGFKQYLKDLDDIEKKQREAFDAEFKGTGKSFAEVTKAAKAYKKQLEDTAKAEKRAAQEAEKLAQAQIRAANKARVAQEKQAQAQQRAAQAASQARRGAVGQIIGGAAGAAIAGGPVGIVAAAAQAINEFRKEAIELSRIQASAEAQLAAAIRSTGGAAGLTANELKAQASALQEVTNFGDEATIVAQSQLLTFTRIGADVFPRATKAILDLATRMDGDLKGATLQVGKALNDPVAGLSALTESGIQFSKEQKDLVKGFAETNQIAKAQAVILKELETQFGGAAEAAREADGGAIALSNALGDLKEELGEILIAFGKTFNTAEVGIGIIGFLQERIKTLQQVVAFAGAGFTAFGTIGKGVFGELGVAVSRLGQLIKGEISFAEFRQPLRDFSDILDEAGTNAIDKFKELATIFGETFDEDKVVKPLEKQESAIDGATQSLEGYQSALRQAEQLQLSFTRSAEDAAIKLARANEDLDRKRLKDNQKFRDRQKKERDKLLADQRKQLKKFDDRREKQVAKAERDIEKERQKARDQRRRDEQKLFRDLGRERDKFNLSQLQSERRFSLSERRLRAEGDILALQQLREDRALEREEEKENFNLSQKQRRDVGREQLKEDEKNFDNRVNELRSSLDEQREELRASFTEQIEAQKAAQLQEQNERRQALIEADAERQIALQREEEDRRLSQQRQLEDLGRSLADQKGVTEQGVNAIAGEIEKVFGMEGVADNIFGGFKARAESDFQELFDNLEKIAADASIPQPRPSSTPIRRPPPGTRTPSGIQAFQEGGIVPGPIGSPQIIQAHGGETVLPTHQQSFTMAAPVIPSQTLNVAMSGGFDITGDGQADEAILQAAAIEMTENFKIAVKRLARRQ